MIYREDLEIYIRGFTKKIFTKKIILQRNLEIQLVLRSMLFLASVSV